MSQPVAVSPVWSVSWLHVSDVEPSSLLHCVAAVLMDFAVYYAQIRDQQAGWLMPVVSRPPEGRADRI